MTITAPPRETDADRRRELSAFLRSRRERLSPAQAGVPLGGRRRTPGLRREEVAQLAGVGVTWYTWLEQGRDIKASDQVLEAIARTLSLDRDERTHLFTLAGSTEPADQREAPPVIPEGLQAVLEKLSPYPACIQNGRYDVLAYNRSYSRLIGDFDSVPTESQNCMYLMFTEPSWAKAHLDRDAAASRMVAQFRAQMAEHVADPVWKAALRRMRTESPEFAALWERHEVSTSPATSKGIRNPWVGLLRLAPVSTWLEPHLGSRMLVYTPADAETRRRLEKLAIMIEAGRCD